MVFEVTVTHGRLPRFCLDSTLVRPALAMRLSMLASARCRAYYSLEGKHDESVTMRKQ